MSKIVLASPKITIADMKSVVKDFKKFVESIKIHPVDPQDVSVTGAVSFIKPIRVEKLVAIDPYGRSMTIITDTSKLLLKAVEFTSDSFYIKATAELLTYDRSGRPHKLHLHYPFYVDALSLLFMSNTYKLVSAGQVEIDEEVRMFLENVVSSIKTILREGYHKHIDVRELFTSFFEETGIGESSIFKWGDWDTVEIVFDWKGFYDEEFAGLIYFKRKIYINLYDIGFRKLDTIGIDSKGHANYKISSSTLRKLALGKKIIENYYRAKRLLQDYFELAKIVFLGVKAYAI